ncbi:MAG: CvpA family protein [Gammaproteobacteria bacterium]|nr:CvpA family protein [Gammaproteobacteria bacterium]
MPVFDIIILVFLLLTLLVGALLGLLRMVIFIISWILAFWVAYSFAEEASVLFTSYLDEQTLRIMGAFAALFIVTLIVASFIGYLITRLAKIPGIKGVDRSLGALFGVIIGITIIAGVVLFSRLTDFPQQPWWQASISVQYFVPLADMLKDLLPTEVAQHFSQVPASG